MATFDQLPPEQRAIIELIVQRRRSYQSLADVLELPPPRIRELARDALGDLAPRTADRVDSEWRGQVADYLLGQQSGPEATATRGHLKRSEAARTWALSVLDSLDALYGDAARPEIPDTGDEQPVRVRGRAAAAPAATPEPDADRDEDREREREAERSSAAERERELERERKRAAEQERQDAAERDRERDRARERRLAREEERDDPDSPPPARSAELSPAARRALQRRRAIGAGIGAVVLAAIVVGVLALAGVFGSSKKTTSRSAASTTGVSTRVQGEIPLQPVGSNKSAQGLAVLASRGSQELLVVQAKLTPSQQGYAYEVWLYNSPTDVASLGAQVTDAQGNYRGQGPLPSSFARYKFIDISYEKIARSTAHNGPSVLRGAFANLQPPPSGQRSTGPAQPGTGALPGQSATP